MYPTILYIRCINPDVFRDSQSFLQTRVWFYRDGVYGQDALYDNNLIYRSTVLDDYRLFLDTQNPERRAEAERGAGIDSVGGFDLLRNERHEGSEGSYGLRRLGS